MTGLRLAGGLWIIGGLSSVAVAFGVLEEPPLLAMMIGGAIVGLGIGTLLIVRPAPQVVRWSSIAGVLWAVAFGALILVEIAAKMGYVRTAIWLTAWGALGALLAFRARPAADVDGGAAR